MRKNKWKKVLIWALSIIVILGIGGLFAANYAADKLLSSLAESLESDLLEEGMAAIAPDPDPSSDAGNSFSEGTEPSDKPQSGTEGTDKGNNSGDEGYKADISVEKAKEVQEKITVAEKAKLTAVFLKQLSMEDIKTLQALASGGLTVEKKKQARSLILEKLTPEQYDDLIQIAKKYGLSQGKSYNDVKKQK